MRRPHRHLPCFARHFGPGNGGRVFTVAYPARFGIGCLIAKGPAAATGRPRAARRVPLWPALPAADAVVPVRGQGDSTAHRFRAPVLQALGDFQLFGLPAEPVPGAVIGGHGGETVRRHAARRRHDARHLLRCPQPRSPPILPAYETPSTACCGASSCPGDRLTLRPAPFSLLANNPPACSRSAISARFLPPLGRN